MKFLSIQLEMRTAMRRASLAMLACLLALSAAQAAYTTSSGTATPADAEAITGGTFLNFRNATTSETRNSLTISTLTLGASVQDVTKSAVTLVNWSVNDTSDGSRLVGGQSVEDNNRRNAPLPGSPVAGTIYGPPYNGTSYNPFSFTLSGLTPGFTYGIRVVALGVREDTGGGQISGVLDANNPDFGINNYDFSYGPNAGAMTTFSDVTLGTLIYEEKSSTATVIGGVNYFSWKGAYACDIGDWTADGSGTINLFMGEGVVNTFLNGSRTMLDGVVVVVPEPTTLALLGLGGLGLALMRRRK